MTTPSGGNRPPNANRPNTPPPSESEDETGRAASPTAFRRSVRRASDSGSGLNRSRSNSQESTASGMDLDSKKELGSRTVQDPRRQGAGPAEEYDPSVRILERPDENIQTRQEELLGARRDLINSLRNNMANEWVQKYLPVLIKALEEPAYAKAIGFSVMAEFGDQTICLAPADYDAAASQGVPKEKLDAMRSYVISSLKSLASQGKPTKELEQNYQGAEEAAEENREVSGEKPFY